MNGARPSGGQQNAHTPGLTGLTVYEDILLYMWYSVNCEAARKGKNEKQIHSRIDVNVNLHSCIIVIFI